MTKRHQYMTIKQARRTYAATVDMEDEADSEWAEKARRLQARRWHKLRNEIRGIDMYSDR